MGKAGKSRLKGTGHGSIGNASSGSGLHGYNGVGSAKGGGERGKGREEEGGGGGDVLEGSGLLADTMRRVDQSFRARLDLMASNHSDMGLPLLH